MEIEAMVKRIIKEIVFEGAEIIELNVHDRLKELGIDSLSYIKVIVKIEEETGIEYPTEGLMMTEESDIMQMVLCVTNCINHMRGVKA